MTAGRRAFLELVAAAALGAELGCATEAPPPRPPAPLPPLATGDLAALLPAPGLRWVVRAHPRAIAQVPWLIPTIAAFAPEARLDRWARTMGFDLRQTPEAWLAEYQLGPDTSQLLLVRHNARPQQLERLFATRLSAEPHRAEDRPDAVRLGGRIGPTEHAFARLGPDVAAWQEGGDPARGPVRIVAARASGGLRSVRGVAATDPLDRLLARFGGAPLVALAPGPFDEGSALSGAGSDAARLLAVATGVGAALRPTAREGLGLAIAVAGAFGADAPAASRVLVAAWEELAASESGRILALDRTRDAPIPTHAPDAVALAVELAPGPVAEGLRALLEQDLSALLASPPGQPTAPPRLP